MWRVVFHWNVKISFLLLKLCPSAHEGTIPFFPTTSFQSLLHCWRPFISNSYFCLPATTKTFSFLLTALQDSPLPQFLWHRTFSIPSCTQATLKMKHNAVRSWFGKKGDINMREPSREQKPTRASLDNQRCSVPNRRVYGFSFKPFAIIETQLMPPANSGNRSAIHKKLCTNPDSCKRRTAIARAIRFNKKGGSFPPLAFVAPSLRARPPPLPPQMALY